MGKVAPIARGISQGILRFLASGGDMSWRERLQMRIAWMMPRWLVSMSAVRIFAHGTTGEWGHTEAPALTVSDALKRWEKNQ